MAIASKGQFANQANPIKNEFILRALNSEFKEKGITFVHSDFFTPPVIGKVGQRKYNLILSKTGNVPGSVKVNNLFGRIFLNEQSPSLAEHFFLKAEQLLSGKSTFADRSSTYANLGDYYSRYHQLGKAILYYGKAITVAKKHNSTPELYRFTNAQVGALLDNGQRDAARKMLTELRNGHLSTSRLENFYLSYASARLSATEKNLPKAMEYFTIGLELSKNLPELNFDCNKEAARVLLGKGQNDRALAYLLEAERLATEIPVDDDPELPGLISDTYAKLGKFRLSHHYLVRKKVIKDSIFNNQRQKNLLELEFRYDNFKKENEIRAKEKNILMLGKNQKLFEQQEKDEAINLEQLKLATEQKKNEAAIRQKSIRYLDDELTSQKHELEWNKKMKIALYIVFMLLAGILVLLFRHYRFKNRSNRLIAQKNTSLNKLVTEKTWLVNEMHERIRINLETIMALLKPTSRQADDPTVAALQVSEHRVFAMSLIHQKLFDSPASDQISIREYIADLVDNLKDSFMANQEIEISLDIDEITFDPEQAVPLGIIINECVTNSFKYAFAGNQKGNISVSLQQVSESRSTLVVRDDGMGFEPNLIIGQGGSLGLKLIKGLTSQLNGTMAIYSTGGTTVIIEAFMHVIGEFEEHHAHSMLSSKAS